jgi:hypothetical protein
MENKEIFIWEDCHNDFIDDMRFESENNKHKKKYYNEHYQFINNY